MSGSRPRALYEDLYCRRGQAENHIKSWKTHLRADRTSCTKATANQFRLFLHAAAYWVLWGVRTLMPRRSYWRAAQFDTLRLRLIKLAVRVVEMKTMIKLHLPTSSPDRRVLHFVLGRAPRLVTDRRRAARKRAASSTRKPPPTQKSGPQSRSGTGASKLSRNHAIAPKALKKSSGDA